MMKSSTSILLLMASIFFLFSCQTPSDNPEAVLKQFFEALSKKDIDQAKKLSTENSQQMLNFIGMDMKKDSSHSISSAYASENLIFRETVINGDAATVAVVNQSEGDEAIQFTLKKEKGQWKVAFDKETLLGMGMKAAARKMDKSSADSSMRALQDVIQNNDSLLRNIREGMQSMENEESQ